MTSEFHIPSRVVPRIRFRVGGLLRPHAELHCCSPNVFAFEYDLGEQFVDLSAESKRAKL